MLDMSAPTLRDRLREGSADIHERLDSAVGGADLRTVDGYGKFLGMNARAFDALARSGATGLLATNAMLDALAHAAATDLDTLGRPRPPATTLRPVLPLAVDYVVLGSRLGTRLLRRTWQTGDEARVLAADRYFTKPEHTDLWRTLCRDLSAMPGDDPAAQTVLDDVKALFALFLESYEISAGASSNG